MKNEQLLADLDEGQNDLFMEFRDRVREHENLTQGALVHAFDALLLFAIGLLSPTGKLTRASLHSVVAVLIRRNVPALISYVRGQSLIYSGCWDGRTAEATRKRIEDLLRSDPDDSDPPTHHT